MEVIQMLQRTNQNQRRAVVLPIILALLVFTIAGANFAGAMDLNEAKTTHIFFHTGSPLLLDGDQILPLDPSNPDVAATVVNDRTLLPLRSFAEHFGAAVSYDAVSRTAIIDHDGVRYKFPIGQKKYIIETTGSSKEVAMDTGSMILNSRTMVPLRVLCEDVFEQKVSYHDRVIAVGDTEIDLKLQTTLVKQVKERIGVALKARTLAEVKLAISGESQYVFGRGIAVDGTKTEAEAPAAEPSNGSGDSVSGGGSSSDHSNTNTQVEGIDEADIVKTDGKNIYIVAEAAIRIVSADNGNLDEIGLLRISDKKVVSEMFLDGDRLVLLGTRNEYNRYEPMYVDGEVSDRMIMPPYDPGKSFSFVDVYDISDPSAPQLLKSHEMEGFYQTSRKNGDIVYLVSNTYSYGGIILPMVRDTATGNVAKEIALDDVMILPAYPSQGFVVISAVNIETKEKASVEAIAASGTVTYMNDHALYVASSDFNGNTAITKFSVSGLSVGYAGSGIVKGYLINQFSMDEHENHLRVATTTWDGGNHLFVLDPSMNVVGSVTGLAKGETIYSVRFLGDKGYIVTFRTVDPLFVFDLSDPKAPKVTGELKIPGFSNYLHPISENFLLGIGMETFEIYQKDRNGNEIVIGTRQGGIKISLFDVSDMGKPKEVSQYVLGDAGSYSEALYNHKAIMFDETRKLLAFDASVTSDPTSYQFQQGAAVISYAGNDLSRNAFLVSVPTDHYGSDIPYGRRVLYIGDELYYVQGGKISSYDYSNFRVIDSLSLF
jgi:uncharacterized secreted protein with C-terminal beta-propeller domain